jgi:chromosome segregation ATPase
VNGVSTGGRSPRRSLSWPAAWRMRCPEEPARWRRAGTACDDRWVADGARGRREAIWQLTDLRRRLATAEDTLTDALAAMKQAEGAFDAASDRFDAAERALDAAREQRAAARRDRYAARQAYERASATADRLARGVRDLAERLDRRPG